jgi:hypothetical protein
MFRSRITHAEENKIYYFQILDQNDLISGDVIASCPLWRCETARHNMTIAIEHHHPLLELRSGSL